LELSHHVSTEVYADTRKWVKSSGETLVVVIGLVVVHGILFHLLRHSSTSHVAVSGVVLPIIAKHLGLVVALLRYLYGLFKRRS